MSVNRIGGLISPGRIEAPVRRSYMRKKGDPQILFFRSTSFLREAVGKHLFRRGDSSFFERLRYDSGDCLRREGQRKTYHYIYLGGILNWGKIDHRMKVTPGNLKQIFADSYSDSQMSQRITENYTFHTETEPRIWSKHIIHFSLSFLGTSCVHQCKHCRKCKKREA